MEKFRKEFKKETNIAPVFAERAPYIDYIRWLEEKLNQALRIHDVVGRSEQLPKKLCTLNENTCDKGSGCKYPHCHL